MCYVLTVLSLVPNSYNDWYNNTLNWVQLYEDSMYNNIKKLDKLYITNTFII